MYAICHITCPLRAFSFSFFRLCVKTYIFHVPFYCNEYSAIISIKGDPRQQMCFTQNTIKHNFCSRDNEKVLSVFDVYYLLLDKLNFHYKNIKKA